MRVGDRTGAFELIDVIALGQGQQTLQHPHALDATALHHALGPLRRVGADQANSA